MRLPREQNTGDYYQIITTGFVRLIVEYNFQFWDWYFENMLFGSIASSIVHLSKEKKSRERTMKKQSIEAVRKVIQEIMLKFLTVKII